MKRIVSIILLFSSVVINQIQAEGIVENSSDKIQPGARIVLEANGYRFNTSNDLISFRNFSIVQFPNENDTNTNPYAYEKNVIYLTNFDVNQWIGKSLLATTGDAVRRSATRLFLPGVSAFGSAISGGTRWNGTRIFIKDISDAYVKEIETSVSNSFLIYVGTQSLNMADGSSQEFPVFQLFDLFNNTVLQALNSFNKSFDSGVYKEEDGYQYSKINDRTFGRDKATKKELYEWDGSQWITL